MTTIRHFPAYLGAIAIGTLLMIAPAVPAFADQGTVDLDCNFRLETVNWPARDYEVRISVDYANKLVSVFSDKKLPDDYLSRFTNSNSYVEDGHMVNRANITDETISWESPSNLGAALAPFFPSWITGAVIDRKTGKFTLTSEPQGGITSAIGTCTKRSDTNKF